MASKIQIKSPLRGIDRSRGREDQPDSSVFDALNVLPYDRTQRLRVGQRAGTAPLFAAISAKTVSGMYQVTLSQVSADPDGGGGGASVDMFPGTYPDGPLAGNGGWTTIPFYDDLTISSGTADTFTSGATFDDWADQNSAPAGIDRTGSYTVTVTFVVNTSTFPLIEIFPEGQSGDPTAGGDFKVDLQYDTPGNGYVSIVDQYSTPHLTHVDLIENAPVQYDIIVGAPSSGTRTVTVQMNSSTIGTATIAESTGMNTNFGVHIGGPGVVSGGDGAVALTTLTMVGSSSTPSQPRTTRLIVTTDTTVYVGTTSGVTQVGSSHILAASKPSITDFNRHVYIVDGTNTFDLDLTNVLSPSIAPLTASAGSVPTGCRVARTWRGRLVLTAADGDPQNYFMSRVGDPTDWDFSQEDAAAAFAGNNSQAGRVNDLILDFIPFTNDLAIFAGDHTLYMMRGDPADNGSVDLMSNGIGIVGRDAWTIAPDGTLYFIGTGGFYKLQQGATEPQPISLMKYDQFFTGLNRSDQYFGLAWNRDKHGCYIFVTSIANGMSTHLWYDVRTDSFWPIKYPDNHGPISSLVYDADGPEDRALLLGGRDGTIRQISDHNRNDDGTDITSYLIMGPFNPYPGAAGKLLTTEINSGELVPADQSNPERWGVTATLNSGPDAYSVTEGTAHSTATIDLPLDRRQKFLTQRLRGSWFSLVLANSADNNYWAFESAIMTFDNAGKQREIR